MTLSRIVSFPRASACMRAGVGRNSAIMAGCRFSLRTFSRETDNNIAIAKRRGDYSEIVSSLRARKGRQVQQRSRRIHSLFATTAKAATASAFSTSAGARSKHSQADGSDSFWMAMALAAGVFTSFAIGAQLVLGKSPETTEKIPENEVLDGKPWKNRIPTRKLHPAGPSRFPDVYDASVGAVKGQRSYMEDNYLLRDGGRFAAVFDGHGGAGVAAFLREHLYIDFIRYLDEAEAKSGGDPTNSLASRVKALRLAFQEVEHEVGKDDALKDQGSTAVAVVLHEDEDGDRTLVSANVGDSRAVLSRSGRAVPLTRDHKPGDPTEQERISSMGGRVVYDDIGDVYRVRGLGVSRSIGDREAKPFVYSEPEFMQLPVVDATDEFVLLASDGLWDVFTNDQAVRYVHKKFHAAEGSTDAEKRRGLSNVVAKEAIRRGSSDNVCVAIVWLK